MRARLALAVALAVVIGCSHTEPRMHRAQPSPPAVTTTTGLTEQAVVEQADGAAVPLQPPRPAARAAPPPAPPATPPAPAAPAGPIEQMILDAWGPDAGPGAVRVARCESGLRPDARNGVHVGLFQLSGRWHQPRAQRLGYSWEQMTEPGPNIAVAHNLWAEQGWRPWACRP